MRYIEYQRLPHQQTFFTPGTNKFPVIALFVLTEQQNRASLSRKPPPLPTLRPVCRPLHDVQRRAQEVRDGIFEALSRWRCVRLAQNYFVRRS